jgi:hypothetical protein
VTLAFKCSTISAGVVWRHGTQLLDILWLSGRGKTPTLCVFPVFSAAVMEECCDDCGYGDTISGRVVWRQRVLNSR